MTDEWVNEMYEQGEWVWEEHNPYEEQPKGFASRCQVIYLHFVENKTINEILEYCRYVRSTIVTYLKKYADMLDEAKEFFKKVWVEFKRNILGKNNFHSRKPHAKDYCAYIIECCNGQKVKFLKIGMASDFEGRMREHIRNKNYEIDGICVGKIFPCQTRKAAIELENKLRNFYRRIKGYSLTRNDRFYGQTFSLKDIQEFKSFAGI